MILQVMDSNTIVCLYFYIDNDYKICGKQLSFTLCKHKKEKKSWIERAKNIQQLEISVHCFFNQLMMKKGKFEYCQKI